MNTTSSEKPRLAIIGAGIAGLNAAYHLQKAGYSATIYEAAPRIGGRMYSATELFGTGLVTELGAEFIDSNHADLLQLVREFKLPLLDREAASAEGLQRRVYYFEGQMRNSTDMVKPVKPLILQIERDLQRLARDFSAAGPELDRLSAAEYLDKLGATGWLRRLWEVVLTGMYGLAPAEQTALNLLWLNPHVADNTAYLLGHSDGRYAVQGGNERIISQLAAHLNSQIETGRPLQAIHAHGNGYRLSFEGLEVEADAVINTIPFSVLRHLELAVELPPTLRRFINEVGYGTNHKLMLGFTERPWHKVGVSGSITSDLWEGTVWDSSQQQGGRAGTLTLYTGGSRGLALSKMEDYTAEVDRLLTQLEPLLPGIRATWTQQIESGVPWPVYQFSQGSYACFKPGQYTEFVQPHCYAETTGQVAGVGVGRMLFAGEHLSDDFQGYMNGAAQTGRLAAAALVRQLAAS